jgi:hypothetical protein
MVGIKRLRLQLFDGLSQLHLTDKQPFYSGVSQPGFDDKSWNKQGTLFQKP